MTPSWPLNALFLRWGREHSSCASACVVMMGRMVLPVKIESTLAFCFAFLITDPDMIALVDLTSVR
jgi:hypothetical protein